MVIEAAITGLETPQALPKATLDGTKTYGTFLSSHSNGKCNRISIGSQYEIWFIQVPCNNQYGPGIESSLE